MKSHGAECEAGWRFERCIRRGLVVGELDIARLELMKQLIRSYQFSILLLGVYLSSGSNYQASAARGMVMRQIMGGVKTVPSDLNMLGLRHV